MALSFETVNKTILPLGVELVRERKRGITTFYFREFAPDSKEAPLETGRLPIRRVTQHSLQSWHSMAEEQAKKFEQDHATK